MPFNLDEFKKDLHQVLEKHNVTLGVEVDYEFGWHSGFTATDNATDVEHMLDENSTYLDVNDLK